MWEDVITLKRCDSSHVGLKIVRKVCQLMERYVAHGKSVQ